MAKSTRKTKTSREVKPAAQAEQVENPSIAMSHDVLSSIEYRLAAMEQRAMAAPAPGVFYPPAPRNQGCDCSKTKCCCFEIYVSRVRVTKIQNPILEPRDGSTTVPGLSSEYMELFINAIVGQSSVLVPNLVAPLKLSSKLGWMSINKVISTVTVKGSKTLPAMVEAREVAGPSQLDVIAEQRPEFGTSSMSQLNLTCGCPVAPILIEVELNAGGKAGGSIEVEISAREVCCDSC